MKRETLVQSEIRAILNAKGSPCRVWRNNVGELPAPGGGRVKYGLCPGSADLVGLIRSTGRFLAVEVKTERKGSKLSAGQIAWQAVIKEFDGIYVVLRTSEEAINFVADVNGGKYAH